MFLFELILAEMFFLPMFLLGESIKRSVLSN